MAGSGRYRIQVWHPSFESKTDAELAPSNSLRRAISSSFAVAADVTLSKAEVSFHDYAAFAPRTTAALPTTFAFGNASALPTRLAVYGTGMAGANPQIGDPWFTSPSTLTASAAFDGAFPSSHATEPNVVLGERYFWGVEQAHPADSAGVVWTSQSMVFPVTWH